MCVHCLLVCVCVLLLCLLGVCCAVLCLLVCVCVCVCVCALLISVCVCVCCAVLISVCAVLISVCVLCLLACVCVWPFVCVCHFFVLFFSRPLTHSCSHSFVHSLIPPSSVPAFNHSTPIWLTGAKTSVGEEVIVADSDSAGFRPYRLCFYSWGSIYTHIHNCKNRIGPRADRIKSKQGAMLEFSVDATANMHIYIFNQDCNKRTGSGTIRSSDYTYVRFWIRLRLTSLHTAYLILVFQFWLNTCTYV